MRSADSDLIAQFFRKTLHLHFVSATLSRTTPTPLVIRGLGHAVRRGACFQFDFYVNEVEAADLVKRYSLGFHMSGRAGQLMDENSLFRFEGVTVDGARWRGSGAIVYLNSNETQCHLHFSLYELSRTADGQSEAGTWVECWLSDAIKLPFDARTETSTKVGAGSISHGWRVDHAEFTVGGFRVTSKLLNKVAYLHVASEHSFQARPVADALMQAACFMSGQPVPWSVLRFGGSDISGVVLRPFARVRRGRLFPPLSHGLAHLYSTDFWQLFGSFMHHAATSWSPSWTPLGRATWRAAEDSEASIDTQGLGLSVCVEHMLLGSFKHLAPTDPGVGAEVDKAIGLIQTVNEPVRRRLVSAMGSLKDVRARDVLLRLKELEVVSDDEVRAWQQLRNGSAHGRFSGAEVFQQSFDRIGLVTTLLHKLAFQVLRYSGKFRNVGKAGYPIEDWRYVEAAPASQDFSNEGK